MSLTPDPEKQDSVGLLQLSRKKDVKVKLFGALARYSEEKTVTISLVETLPFTEFLEKLNSKLSQNLDTAILNLNDVLLLLNGREISVLEGNDAKISPGDEIVLLPVSHGGSE
ncbi:MAG: MoaD/ThiS family protein [Candidatus Bathyarchaeota archaeon]|nr:MAG: MoaD/ThiS family protein [Candidatus Bathyarchaeota archaeon]